MKTFSNSKAAFFGLVGLFLLAAGCTAEKVDDIGAEDLKSSSRTVGRTITFKGIVFDAMRNSQCYDDTYSKRFIHGAQISLPAYDITTVTDECGEYTLNLSIDRLIQAHGKNFLLQDLQFLIITQYDGYVGSSMTYEYAAFYEGELGTGYFSNILGIDFPMTKRQPVQTLTAEGGTFMFDDCSITVPSGAVSEDTDFSLTRIEHQQVRGFTNRDISFGIRATELERFYLYPATLQFVDKVATISFQPTDAFPLQENDEVFVTKLIGDNLWYDDKDSHYREGDLISFEAKSGDTYRVHAHYADHNCEVFEDIRYIHNCLDETLANCDCGVAVSMDIRSKKIKRENLVFENDISDELANRILRQIRSSGNIPGVSKNCVRYKNEFSYYTQSCPYQITVDQCETINLRVDERVRSIRGKMYGQNFVYTYHYTFDTDLTSGKCSTKTACHQGC